mmetsp:Transcript_8215/g.4351  ORF Transcript_8215/g.4351 Transcript_8215/m.4351 type:complete len:276 (+) Transcript_8215:5084-5911(+)
MRKIKIMINGLPGNMAATIARHASSDNRFELIPYSLTGPEITDKEFKFSSVIIKLVPPDKSHGILLKLKKDGQRFIIIDYTHPSAVNTNGVLYCGSEIPFVMGTTGGDRDLLEKEVKKSLISAVIATNMAKQIVGFQAMMEFAANKFPYLFNGYSLKVKESHQKGKADTSGTAKEVIEYFKELGANFFKGDLYMERDSEKQRDVWKIPEEHLKGHGWHTYTLVSVDGDVKVEFTHNINGRNIYVQGTLDAVIYLTKKFELGEVGKVFSMIDVLKS